MVARTAGGTAAPARPASRKARDSVSLIVAVSASRCAACCPGAEKRERRNGGIFIVQLSWLRESVGKCLAYRRARRERPEHLDRLDGRAGELRGNVVGDAHEAQHVQL